MLVGPTYLLTTGGSLAPVGDVGNKGVTVGSLVHESAPLVREVVEVRTRRDRAVRSFLCGMYNLVLTTNAPNNHNVGKVAAFVRQSRCCNCIISVMAR